MRLYEAILEWDRDTWIALSFVPIALLFVLALWRADRGSESTFKFIHFVTNELGRGSYYALGYTMLVVVSSWGLWVLIVTDRLTEYYLTVVCSVFVLGALGGTVARVIGKVKGASDPAPDAGDLPEATPPALERETVTREKVSVPAAPPAVKPKGGK